MHTQLVRHRRDAYLTQAELAAELGVAVNTVCNWETGKTYPELKLARRLSAFCGGLPVADLMRPLNEDEELPQ